jgi:hypothetical protein
VDDPVYPVTDTAALTWPAGLLTPVVQPDRPISTADKSTVQSPIPGKEMDLPRRRFRNKPPSPNRIVARTTPSSLPGGGRNEADKVVLTVSSVELVLPVPSGVTVAGLKLQVAPGGSPEHWKPTAWLKPPTESSVSG